MHDIQGTVGQRTMYLFMTNVEKIRKHLTTFQTGYVRPFAPRCVEVVKTAESVLVTSQLSVCRVVRAVIYNYII